MIALAAVLAIVGGASLAACACDAWELYRLCDTRDDDPEWRLDWEDLSANVRALALLSAMMLGASAALWVLA